MPAGNRVGPHPGSPPQVQPRFCTGPTCLLRASVTEAAPSALPLPQIPSHPTRQKHGPDGSKAQRAALLLSAHCKMGYTGMSYRDVASVDTDRRSDLSAEHGQSASAQG